MLSSRQRDVKLGLHLFKKAFEKETDLREQAILREILDCARLARKETILALEPRIERMGEPFLRDTLRAVVDGVDAKVIRETFEGEIHMKEEKFLNGAKVWSDAGGFAPTIGIIGAVLGLIHVMGNLSDTSKLGAGIAVAFVATIYGVGFANLIFLPIGNKLKKRVSKETKALSMILEGALCIQAGLPPTIVDIRLRGFIEKD